MKEYKIIESLRNTRKTEELLNSLAEDSWCVIAVTEYQVWLEREKTDENKNENTEVPHLIVD